MPPVWRSCRIQFAIDGRQNGCISWQSLYSVVYTVFRKSRKNSFTLKLCLVFRTNPFHSFHLSFSFSASVFLCTLAKPEFRLVTLVGSCTAWSMESSLMVKCPVTRQSVEEMIPSTHFSARLEQENTFLAPSLLIWNQPSSVS